jgi:hypothetical protein
MANNLMVTGPVGIVCVAGKQTRAGVSNSSTTASSGSSGLSFISVGTEQDKIKNNKQRLGK